MDIYVEQLKQMNERFQRLPIQAIDLFCGCGGTAEGFRKVGIEVLLALDNDRTAAETFKHNFPDVVFLEKNIRDIRPNEILECLPARRVPDMPLIVSACAPCQPFSKMRGTRGMEVEQDDRSDLLLSLMEILTVLQPDYVLLENVPGIRRDMSGTSVFRKIEEHLVSLGYVSRAEVVNCQNFGVPQTRRRLILLATKLNRIAPWPAMTHNSEGLPDCQTVGGAISRFPKIEAGETHPSVPNHTSAKLSPRNLERIKATPVNGSRDAWPRHLHLECHKSHSGHSDVYGRLKENQPAPAMTTRCISLSNGRFGHPVQNRAISVREAAAIQTFPDSFVFQGNLVAQARQVGNAVPPSLSAAIGKSIIEHYERYIEDLHARV